MSMLLTQQRYVLQEKRFVSQSLLTVLSDRGPGARIGEFTHCSQKGNYLKTAFYLPDKDNVNLNIKYICFCSF